MPRRERADRGPRAADLIEEAVHLLRGNMRELAAYYAGAGLFVVALLYGWAYVTWFAPADGEIALGALSLVVLFGVMKTAQAHFARRMLALRAGEIPGAWSWRDGPAEVARQLRQQALGIVLVPLAAVFAVPFAWVYGYYQSLTVTGRDEDASTAAWTQAKLWPVRHHWALAILGGLWLMVFLNLAAAFYMVPSLATRWLGLQTMFAFSGWSYFNTTYLAIVVALTYLAVDPLIKTYYVLRVFHGRAQHTGADLRLVIRRERVSRLAALVILVALCVGMGGNVRAEETPPVSVAPEKTLDAALDRVLEEPEFRWRLRPPPPAPDQEQEGIVKGFVRATFKVIGQGVETVRNWFRKTKNWFGDLFGGKDRPARAPVNEREPTAPFDWMGLLQLMAFVLLVVVVALLIFVGWRIWRHNRSSIPVTGSAPMPVSKPDLRDEHVEASRLPEDGWLALAREQMAAGEWRLALRALFLATLARHAQAGRLTLARFKTNMDYESELRRRAPGQGEVIEDFHGRRRQFEDVWYGAAPASDRVVREWIQRMEVNA